MTRLRSFAGTALGATLALAALGFFAGVGLVVLGMATLIGLLAAAVAWVFAILGPREGPQTTEAS